MIAPPKDLYRVRAVASDEDATTALAMTVEAAHGEVMRLTGSAGADTELFFSYLGRSDMRVSDLVPHRYPPHQAAEAYNRLIERRAEAMGVIFDWAQLT